MPPTIEAEWLNKQGSIRCAGCGHYVVDGNRLGYGDNGAWVTMEEPYEVDGVLLTAGRARVERGEGCRYNSKCVLAKL